MTARGKHIVSVDLGPLADRAEARVRSGAYASVEEVVREGLRALEREEAILDRALPPIDDGDPEWQAHVREKIREALEDPRPPIPAEEVRRRLRERHESRLRRGL